MKGTSESSSRKSRRETLQPNILEKEKKWFQEKFPQPHGVSDILAEDQEQKMMVFQYLIWNNPGKRIQPEYKMSTDELAALCGEGRDGWLTDGHMDWILQKVNEAQTTSVCYCLPFNPKKETERLGKIKRFIFVANVGHGEDGSVVFGHELKKEGNHWVLIIVEVDNQPSVTYYDSLGWDAPSNVKENLEKYTKHFGVTLSSTTIKLAHVPSGIKHNCRAECLSYPLQSCGSACGLVAITSAVAAALDDNLFRRLSSSKGEPSCFLHEPSKYNRYLRRVLITWFIEGTVGTSLLTQQQQPPNSFATYTPAEKRTPAGTRMPAQKRTPAGTRTPAQKRTPAGTQVQADKFTPTEASKPDGMIPNTWFIDQTVGSSLLTQQQPPNSFAKRRPAGNRTPAGTGTPAEKRTPAGTRVQANKIPPTEASKPVGMIPNTSRTLSPSLHNKKKPKCLFCFKEFSTRQSLSVHKKTMHPNLSSSPRKQPPTSLISQMPADTQVADDTQRLADTHTERIADTQFADDTQRLADTHTLADIQVESDTHTPANTHTHPDIQSAGTQVPADKVPPTAQEKMPKCLLCDTVFSNRSALSKHKSRKHKTGPRSPIKQTSNLPVTKAPSNTEAQANKQATAGTQTPADKQAPAHLQTPADTKAPKSTRGKPKGTKHQTQTSSSVGRNLLYKCCLCSCKYGTMKELANHYQRDHSQDMEIQQKEFQNMAEFMKWKNQTEKDTHSKYTKSSGSKETSDHKIMYYHCRRSGKRKNGTARKRIGKLKGSCKIGMNCMSFMTVRQSLANGTVAVKYCLNHCGHSCDLGQLPLSEDIRQLIAGKLGQGLEPGRVLDDIRDSVTDMNRDSLVTKKDIGNIKAQYNTSRIRKHKEDGQSVHLWVSELQNSENNPVFCYKKQGEHHSHLKPEDFLLCIQTEFQREMMLKYASKLICVDSTYNTTQYNFILTTILVIDDLEEAVPIAWALSNREDADMLSLFMTGLRDRCGEDIATQIFMSDLSNTFYNAWCSAFSRPVKRLYCSWHVQRAWKKKIQQCFPAKPDQSHVYKCLKTVQSETDQIEFRKTLEGFINQVGDQSPDFIQYFIGHYVGRDKEPLWAACYRIGTLTNTNMYAEAFHRVLKGSYLNKKQNRRVDELLSVLLKISRDKSFEQKIKLEKGKVTHRMRNNTEKHKSAKEVQGITRSMSHPDEWIVPSSSYEGRSYSVKKVYGQHCQCKIRCHLCSVCLHMYTCTCLDYSARSVACKHIHAVHMYEGQIAEAMDMQDSDSVDSEHIFKAFPPKADSNRCANIDNQRAVVDSFLNELSNLSKSTNKIGVVHHIAKNVASVLQSARCLEEVEIDQHFEVKKTFPSNKNFETQTRFYSTRRKTEKAFSQPSISEIMDIKRDLSSQSVHLCAICHKEDDRTNNFEVHWFQCISCDCWVHVSCDSEASEDGVGKGQCSHCRSISYAE